VNALALRTTSWLTSSVAMALVVSPSLTWMITSPWPGPS